MIIERKENVVLKKYIKEKSWLNTNDEVADDFIELIELRLRIMWKFLDSDLTDDWSFYTLLREIYDIKLSKKDYLKIFSMHYDESFIDVGVINTNMTKIKTRNYGRIEELVSISYKIAYTDEFEPNPEHNYTISQIKRLVEKNKIVILEEIHNYIDAKDKKDEYYKFPVYKPCAVACNDKYFNSMVKYLRKKISMKDIINDINIYLKELIEEIDKVKNAKKHTISDTSKECMRRYEQKGLDEEIIDVKHKIKQKKKEIKAKK